MKYTTRLKKWFVQGKQHISELNDDELFLNLPPFFEEWKKKVGLLK